jgi:hypothetical protein
MELKVGQLGCEPRGPEINRRKRSKICSERRLIELKVGATQSPKLIVDSAENFVPNKPTINTFIDANVSAE